MKPKFTRNGETHEEKTESLHNTSKNHITSDGPSFKLQLYNIGQWIALAEETQKKLVSNVWGYLNSSNLQSFSDWHIKCY